MIVLLILGMYIIYTTLQWQTVVKTQSIAAYTWETRWKSS